MNGLLGMGLLGWALALVLGFVVGGVFFMSIKAQVDYVVRFRGPTWLVPVGVYARVAFVGAVLFMMVMWVPQESLGGAMMGGVVGSLVARVLVSRMARAEMDREEGDDAG